MLRRSAGAPPLPSKTRQGMLRVARATGEAERAWLKEAVAVLDQPPS
ncbi:hypothetical protein [Streptomyces sp. NPDC018693]